MPPKQAEEFLADAVSGKLETAEVQKAELALRFEYLTGKLRKLLAAVERNQIEAGMANDNDMPLTKSSENETKNVIMTLLQQLGIEYEKNGATIAEINEKLRAVEVRIRSLEQLFPGEGEKS